MNGTPELLRRGWEAWSRGDIDGLMSMFDPAVEYDAEHFESWPEEPVYRGRESVRRFIEDFVAHWERFEAGAERFVVLGEDRVLVLCWQQGCARGGSVPVRMDWAQVFTVRDGRVSRVEAYSDRREAFASVGLR